MSKDYSLWAEAKTKHGLQVDEVVSGLQKSIRRSMTELACRYAYELYTTSPVLLEKLCQVEGIGAVLAAAWVLIALWALRDWRRRKAAADRGRNG